MNTKQIGDISEAEIITAFKRQGIPVLIPFGDNERYDIVVEINKQFKRIQIKTGRYGKDRIEFNTISSYRGTNNKSVVNNYIGDIDYFAIHCPILNKNYLVNINKASKSKMYLRVKGNKNIKKINWSEDYDFNAVLAEWLNAQDC